MKIPSSIRSLTLVLVLGATSLSAQSCAATNSFANASSHAINASGEVLAAGANSVAGSVQAGAAVVAVPVWMSGAVASGAGQLSTAVGDSALKGGDKLWDFASGDPAQRPALDRNHPVTPPTSPAAAKPKDPSPAEALKRL
jgi:hypothetical protein